MPEFDLLYFLIYILYVLLLKLSSDGTLKIDLWNTVIESFEI